MTAGGTHTGSAGLLETSPQVVVSFIATLLTFVTWACLIFAFLGSWALIAVFFVYALARFASVAIHEVGHAVGSILVGWKILVFDVWRFAFHAPTRSFLLVSQLSEARHESGYVYSVPAGPRRDTK